MNKEKRLTPPCLGCEDRRAGCHNDSCPHGWAEYEAQHIRIVEERQARNEIISASRLTLAKKKAIRNKENEMGWKK